MLQTETRSSKPHPHPIGFAPRLNLSTANRVAASFSRDAVLLEASIAGVVLSFNPRDDEMREKAERSWESIRPLLASELLDENAGGLPWRADAAIGSATAAEILRKRYLELRGLARTVDSTSFELGSDADIAGAGKALCRLAVKLDDLTEGTERRLVNKLRQYVFSSETKRSLTV
ncbi:MAG TPA: hypothetical protein VMT64_00150 [Candidatus Binataceae bacterium]|nr:hypothetical protein [Candidatus Binataceae bacterium]